jgi:MtN3 and saliva related transmembrane protein
MDEIAIIGTAAAACSIASFLPQSWRIIRTRDTGSVSLPTYMLTTAAFGLWLTFGWLSGEWPMIAANFICFSLAAFILIMRALPDRQTRKVAAAIDPTGPEDQSNT